MAFRIFVGNYKLKSKQIKTEGKTEPNNKRIVYRTGWRQNSEKRTKIRMFSLKSFPRKNKIEKHLNRIYKKKEKEKVNILSFAFEILKKSESRTIDFENRIPFIRSRIHETRRKNTVNPVRINCIKPACTIYMYMEQCCLRAQNDNKNWIKLVSAFLHIETGRKYRTFG